MLQRGEQDARVVLGAAGEALADADERGLFHARAHDATPRAVRLAGPAFRGFRGLRAGARAQERVAQPEQGFPQRRRANPAALDEVDQDLAALEASLEDSEAEGG